ncbi:GTP pyrophosphokinase [Campylobacter devanensis]|uniref:GTP pyrophosphokinase n=1 Tax=Campylobacter devanensis TaxID=3161138 RepID=UPI000A336CFA|nr:hypothetical protein [Campylobacter sp. P0139]
MAIPFFNPDEVILEYKNNLKAYDLFEKILRANIEKVVAQIVEDGKIAKDSYEIKSRVKTPESLKGKITREDKIYVYKYPLREITDLVGAKVMLISLNDEEIVFDALEKHFKNYIDYKNSPDKTKELWEQRKFGYSGRHLVLWYSDDMLNGLSNELKKEAKNYDLSEFRAEIQIKTLLQHVWAEIEHKVRYKAQEFLSTHRKRAFDRLAALTELTDSLFKDLINKEEEFFNTLNQALNEVSPELTTHPQEKQMDDETKKEQIKQNADAKLKNIEISSEAIKIYVANEFIKDCFKRLQSEHLIITYDEEPNTVNFKLIEALYLVGINDINSLHKLLSDERVIKVLHAYAQKESQKIENKLMLQKLSVLQILIYAYADLNQKETIKKKHLLYENICSAIDELQKDM